MDNSELFLHVIDCLLNGVDPINLDDLPKESILKSIIVIKSLEYARFCIEKFNSTKNLKAKKNEVVEKFVEYGDMLVIINEDGAIITDMNLYERLKLLRREIARESKLSPFIIFHNKHLARMATYYPTTKAELLEINGIGQYKYEKYGESVLKVINDYLDVYTSKKETQEVPVDATKKIKPSATIETIEKQNIPSCKRCKLRLRNDCFGAKEICEDFEYVPEITDEELDSWPKYGDATMIKRRW